MSELRRDPIGGRWVIVDTDQPNRPEDFEYEPQSCNGRVCPFCYGNESITPQQIVQLGHIHVLGFSLLFISIATILLLSNIGEVWKVMILSLLFFSFSLDIGGLFLVRFVSGGLAVISFISGMGTGVGMAVISWIALYDMWLKRR